MIPCHATNYQSGRAGTIQYLVIHYTAGNGDTAKDNCQYFKKNPGLYASAHYFVDETGWEQSVADADTAWHCGANTYQHPKCRNSNSIGIELCSRKDIEGSYYFLTKTIDNAAELTKQLMKKYRIPAGNVIRNYDVTGKNCPAPFVENKAAWKAFKEELEDDMTQERFNTMMDTWLAQRAKLAPSGWSEQDRAWAESNGIIQGDGNGNKRYKSFVTREELAAVLHRVPNK